MCASSASASGIAPLSLTGTFLTPIKARPSFVLLFYLLLAAACCSYPTTHFTENTDSSFIASSDSLSGTALDVYIQKYGESMMDIIAVLTVPEGDDVRTSPDARALAADLGSWSTNYTAAKCGLSSNSITYYQSADAGLNLIADQFISPNNRSTFVATEYDCSITVGYATDFRDYADRRVPAGMSIGVTGIELFQVDTLAGVETGEKAVFMYINICRISPYTFYFTQTCPRWTRPSSPSPS